jgi:hypothetical protein
LADSIRSWHCQRASYVTFELADAFCGAAVSNMPARIWIAQQTPSRTSTCVDHLAAFNAGLVGLLNPPTRTCRAFAQSEAKSDYAGFRTDFWHGPNLLCPGESKVEAKSNFLATRRLFRHFLLALPTSQGPGFRPKDTTSVLGY